jgi:hypothetical protein
MSNLTHFLSWNIALGSDRLDSYLGMDHSYILLFDGGSTNLHGFPVPLQRTPSYVCKTSRDSGSGRDIVEHIYQVIWRYINLTRLVLIFEKIEDLYCGWSIARCEGTAACDKIPQRFIDTAAPWTRQHTTLSKSVDDVARF